MIQGEGKQQASVAGVNRSKQVLSDFQAAVAAWSSSATPSSEVIPPAKALLVDKLAQDFNLDPDDIDPARPLVAYGVDSLVAVQLRNWFGTVFKAKVGISGIVQSASLAELARSTFLASNGTS